MPANFKTFEAQSRLLAAVIAAHPGLKLDYKGKSASSVFISSFQLHDPSPPSRCSTPSFVSYSSAYRPVGERKVVSRTTGLIGVSHFSTLWFRHDYVGHGAPLPTRQEASRGASHAR